MKIADMFVPFLGKETLPARPRFGAWLRAMLGRAVVASAMCMAGYQIGLRVAHERDAAELMLAGKRCDDANGAGLWLQGDGHTGFIYCAVRPPRRCDWRTAAGVCMDFLEVPEP